MTVLIMAQPNKIHNAIGARDLISMSGTGTDNKTLGQQLQQQEKPMFHDFLGMKVGIDSSVVLVPKTGEARLAEASPSASVSLGGSSGGGRGPISTTSDLGSERQVGDHLEGVPFYGPRSDVSGHDINNRLAGNKRSNSDSTFMGSSRERVPQMGHDSLESLRLMKIFRNGAAGERPRRSSDDEVLYGMKSMRPTSASLILQPPTTGNRFDANAAKWERSIPMGPLVQYPPRGGQFVPFMQQVPSNRFKDAHTGSTIISHSAADEGSRTGIKGPGILSSLKTGGGVSDNNSTGTLISGSRAKSGIHVSEPESSTPNRQGLMSGSQQMTIFYGGQAHVFDDVHPNKADVIMALAGSNGGSWSTTYSPKSVVRPASDDRMSRIEYETAIAGTAAFPREFHGRISGTSKAAQDTGSGDQLPTSRGGHQGGIAIAKAKESGTEDKRETQS